MDNDNLKHIRSRALKNSRVYKNKRSERMEWTFLAFNKPKTPYIKSNWYFCRFCLTEEPPYRRHCILCNKCTANIRYHCKGRDCECFVAGDEEKCYYGHEICRH